LETIMKRIPLPLFCAVSLFCITAMTLMTGCGGPSQASNSIKGKITVDGETCANGTIIFHGDKKDVPGPILNGKYNVDEPPTGTLTVSIKTASGAVQLVGGDKGKAPEAKDTGIGTLAGGNAGKSPNKKYESKETSGLTYEFKGGRQEKNWELAP
jgi:hypothetical protein